MTRERAIEIMRAVREDGDFFGHSTPRENAQICRVWKHLPVAATPLDALKVIARRAEQVDPKL